MAGRPGIADYQAGGINLGHEAPMQRPRERIPPSTLADGLPQTGEGPLAPACRGLETSRARRMDISPTHVAMLCVWKKRNEPLFQFWIAGFIISE